MAEEMKPDLKVETDAVGTQGEGSDVKNWTNSLPRKFRDEAAGFESFAEYLESLHAEKKDSTKKDEDDSWTRLKSELGGGEEADGISKLMDTFRTRGVTADATAEILAEIGKFGQGLEASRSKRFEEATESELKELWKGDYEARKKDAERGGKRYSSILERAKAKGLDRHAEFQEMLSILGGLDVEPTSPRGKTASDFDPKNPLGF